SCRYPMLCFTLVGKAERVPALALLPLPCGPKCCAYSMNPGAEDGNSDAIGLVELIEIDYIHRSGEFQIIIAPDYQGKGFARSLIQQALHYSFTILNLHKVYLIVAVENVKAIHLYEESGFIEEGKLVQEFFINGKYRDVKRMYILQDTFLAQLDSADAPETNWL
ncbi:GNAT family N-acetyltransferase, partial [Halomonas casei]|uniref:GNAT family N-acetyltransferase n=2 Tax=Halomonas casei TaxID=2742613 RepID=UPI0039F0CD63